MIPDDFESEFNKRLLTMRIILGAVLAGVTTFAAIVVFLRVGRQLQGHLPADILTYVGLAFTAGTLLAYVLVPGRIVQAARWQVVQLADPAKQDAASRTRLKLCDVYQTQLLIRAGLLDGTAFLWLLFFLTSGHWYMFGFALAAALFLALSFPTADGLSRWLNQQEDLIESERRLG